MYTCSICGKSYGNINDYVKCVNDCSNDLNNRQTKLDELNKKISAKHHEIEAKINELNGLIKEFNSINTDAKEIKPDYKIIQNNNQSKSKKSCNKKEIKQNNDISLEDIINDIYNMYRTTPRVNSIKERDGKDSASLYNELCDLFGIKDKKVKDQIIKECLEEEKKLRN